MITGITDLQIVNGGQTTASLFYATQGGRDADLADVFVQMKLVVVTVDDAVAMVPLISRYANSQNAVREDDFFSNSPFHVRMEELSKRVLVPTRSGVSFQTKWYYERTRGQYLNDRNRRSTSEQKKFEAEFPRAQVITKVDAAKYVVAWERQPHLVSGGAQKNFKAFAALVSEQYSKQPEAFNENYFRRLVAKTILFNSIRTAISKADWYEAGYLANLTAYAMAKLSLEMSRDARVSGFDLLRIWDNQCVGEAMLAEAVTVARLALDVLTSDDRLVVNVTEWAKRDSAWKRLAETPHELSSGFVRECIPITLNAVGERTVTVNSRFPHDVPEMMHLEEIEEGTWRKIRTFLSGQSQLSSADDRRLREVIPMRRGWFERDAARELLAIYVKALNSGWREEL
ncbi:AIPR family protein [Dermatophilaceae bacterium Soc4.6]